MADFRQLALEFVLADEEGQQTALAQKAATEIQSAAVNTNPVARWVEAVQPWMPGSQGNEGEDGDDTPDWTARAKALEFLSRTLDFLDKEVLKPSQVKLLISFFGAMFDVDHKAGIMPSANALARIAAMKSFQASSGNEIMEKVCALKDDFPRQVAKTRLAVYSLFRLLITSPEVISDLMRRYGSEAEFMDNLLRLCRSERDPDCLMVWFDTLRFFLAEYFPGTRIMEEVYTAFKAYFPIALPRASQSGITPDELKLQLRKCFSANSELAPHAFPFLLGKLDQGDGVTVNVKVDILKTIKACLEEYGDLNKSIVPYMHKIWDSLKYEVRNGEIEDTIWGTLEVLKTLTLRLHGDNLSIFVLTVTRDCVHDLSNAAYTAPAGRLVVSILSTKPSAFVLMAPSVITHIKENLRHAKSPAHSQDLHKILHVVLQTRLLLVGTEMDAEDRDAFTPVDPIIVSLYEDVYKTMVQNASNLEVSDEEISVAAQAVQGAGALVCQRTAKAHIVGVEEAEGTSGRLLPDEQCSQLCQALFSITTRSTSEDIRSDNLDNLINETTKALQRAIQSYTSGFEHLITQGMEAIRSSWRDSGNTSANQTITTLGSLLAYVGCSELPQDLSTGLNQFLRYVSSLSSELFEALDAKADPKIWCALAATIQTTIRYFSDACQVTEGQDDSSFDATNWLGTIQHKYPILGRIATSGSETSSIQPSKTTVSSVAEARDDFLMASLYIVRTLYRRATQPIETHPQSGKKALALSGDFSGVDQGAEYQYLYLISVLAGFVVHEMSEPQQSSLQVEDFVVNLFRDDFIEFSHTASEEQNTPDSQRSVTENGSQWGWLVSEKPNVLSLELLEALRPSPVARLFDSGVAQQLILHGCFAASQASDAFARPATLTILTILANKYHIENLGSLMKILNERSTSLLSSSGNEEDDARRLEQITSLYAIAAGLLRRYGDKEAQGLFTLIREAPKDTTLGNHLGRRLEMLVAPQRPETKANYAFINPLWMQKAYYELVKPMLHIATGGNKEIKSATIKANYSIGVLLMVKHMKFAIYEEDAEKVLRIAIAIGQKRTVGPDTRAALEVIKNTLVEAPEHGQGHLRSITKICVNAFAAEHKPGVGDRETEAECAKVAFEITGGLPRLFETRHLLTHAPHVQRALTLACGHQVRELRKTARLARAAWVDLK